MEPKFSSPESTPGGEPRPPERLEQPDHEYEAPHISPERREAAPVEQPSQPPAASVQPAQIALPTPVVPQTDDQAGASDDDMPLTAADDDLIEKEWVDKAKKIIADTREDPHKREKEVGRLQADYLKKRYGKELGTSS